jgi:hypothetical protein
MNRDDTNKRARTMPNFDPLAILDKVNRMSDAEIARGAAEWRALYGELNPFAVGPFVEYSGAPLSYEGRRLASLLNRAIHGRLPITADIRFELHHFLAAPLRSNESIDQRHYDMALHRQKLIALLERYGQRIKQRRPRFRCVDCGKDTNKSGEYYMVRDEVWAASKIAPHGGMLCLRCLERRIGREVNGQDFTAMCPSRKAWNKHVAARARPAAKRTKKLR